jgi:hypothetical protein
LSEVLTGPVLAAAALVCVAAVGKLREPGGAVRAVSVLVGRPARTWQVRAVAGLELVVGVTVLVAPTSVPVAVLAGLYGTFAGAGAALRVRGVGCGCFGAGAAGGADDAVVSVAHVALSAVLAAVCAAGAAWPGHAADWAVTRPALAVGIAGCVYALVLAYTQLPVAWGAWRAR